LKRDASERTLKAAQAAGIILVDNAWPRTKEGAGQRIAQILQCALLRSEALGFGTVRNVFEAESATAALHPTPPPIQSLVNVAPPGPICNHTPRAPYEGPLNRTPRMARVWRPTPAARRHSLPPTEKMGHTDDEYIGCVSWNYSSAPVTTSDPQQIIAEPEPEAPVASVRTAPPIDLVTPEEVPSRIDRFLAGCQIASGVSSAAAIAATSAPSGWKLVAQPLGKVASTGAHVASTAPAALPAIVSPRKAPSSRDRRSASSGAAREGPGWRYGASS